MQSYDQTIATLRQRCARSGTDIAVQSLLWADGVYLAKPWRGRDERERNGRAPWPTDGLYADDSAAEKLPPPDILEPAAFTLD